MRKHLLCRSWCLVLCSIFTLSLFAQARAGQRADGNSIDVKAFERLEWRSIGPANMGGRTSDVEGIPGTPALV